MIINDPKRPSPHAWQAEHLRLAVEAAGVALWAWNVDDDHFTMDERGFELWGVPWRETVTFDELSEHIHPADRDRVRAAFAATRAVLGPYETDFRILVGDEIRWIAARGQGEDVGIVGRTMFGIFLDVTGRKQAEEGHELLAGEMSHRVKNLLAIAAGLTQITSRTTGSTQEMARELIQRLTALGRAHDLVRPLPDGQGSAALLGALFSVLLAPYDDMGAFSGRTVAPGNAEALVRQWRELHGLTAAPSRTGRVDGHQHNLWTAADGTPLIEQHMITGMGHGTPLNPGTGEGQSGEAGAHMLDVGISSTDRIAEFFGIAPRVAAVAKSDRSGRPETRIDIPTAPAAASLQATIEKALRAAGLMR